MPAMLVCVRTAQKYESCFFPITMGEVLMKEQQKKLGERERERRNDHCGKII